MEEFHHHQQNLNQSNIYTQTTNLASKILIPNSKTLLPVLNKLLILKNSTSQQIVPSNPNNLFNCFEDINLEDVKVVIVGQDPYPGKNIATGTPFACKEIQPSLDILLKEIIFSKYGGKNEVVLNEELYKKVKEEYKQLLKTFDSSLIPWKKQGVLLLNASFTCFENRPSTHTTIWREYVGELIKQISLNKFDIGAKYNPPIIFVLLGRVAQSFDIYINDKINTVLKFPHPASEAYNTGSFLGCGMFTKINEELEKTKQTSISWI